MQTTRRWGPVSLLVVAAVLTSPWTGVKVAGFGLSDLLIVLATVGVVVGAAAGVRRVAVQPWMLAPTVAALIVLTWDVMVRGLSLRSSSGSTAFVSGEAALGGEDGGAIFIGRLALATLLVAVIIHSEVVTYGRDRGVTILRWWAGGIFASSAAAITDSLGISNFSALTFHQIAGDRAFGLAFHPNSLAQTVVLGIPVMLYFTARSKGNLARIFWLAAVGIGMWAVVLTASRAGLIVGFGALVVGIFVMLWAAGGGARTALVVLAVPLLLAALATAIWGLENTRLAGSESVEQSNQGRIMFLEQGMAAFVESPIIGLGLGQGSGVLVPVLLLSTGGVILFVGYYWFIVVPLSRTLRTRGDLFQALNAVSILALLGIGMLNNSVYERFDFVVVSVAAAVALVAQRSSGGTDGVRPSISSRRSLTLSHASIPTPAMSTNTEKMSG